MTYAKILAALLLAPLLALAQPAPPASAASAPTDPPPVITTDTACGAAGTGYISRYPSDGTRRQRIVTMRPADTAAAPGRWSKRVDASGDWVACIVPRPPNACQARSVGSFGAGGRCRPMSDPPGQVRILPAAPLGKRATVIDQEWMGRQTWECQTAADGAARWVQVDGYCRR